MTILHIETTERFKPGTKFKVRELTRFYRLFGKVGRVSEWEEPAE